MQNLSSDAHAGPVEVRFQRAGEGGFQPPGSGAGKGAGAQLNTQQDAAVTGKQGCLPPQAGRAGITRWVCLVLLGWLACLDGIYPVAHAQTNAASPSVPANRYLLLVETSRTMQSRRPGMVQTVQDLLGSGLNGQMHVGDSLGVWTFNSKLNAGRFPLQDWLSRGQSAVVFRVTSFLKEQPYERKANFDKAWPELAQLVQDSPFLTIVLISSGETEILGTPFDAPINEYFRTWRDQQQQAQMPFATVLRAKDGKITHYAVAAAPWPLELPPLPTELLPSPVAAKPASAAPPKPQPVMAAPLILSGKKPAPAPAPQPVEGVEATPPPVVVVESAAIQTNLPPAVTVSSKATSLSGVPLTPDPSPHRMGRGEPEYRRPEPQAAGTPASTQAQTPAPHAISPVSPPIEVPVVVAQPAPASGAVHAETSSTSSPSENSGKSQGRAEPSPEGPRFYRQWQGIPAQLAAFFHRPSVWVGSLLLAGAFAGLWLWLWLRARRSPPASHVSLITQSLERQKR